LIFMNNRFKDKIFYLLFSILLISFHPQTEIFCQQHIKNRKFFLIEEGVSHIEVELEEGQDFTIRLMGKGWYLNRFDSNSIEFKARFPEEGFTEFLFNSLTKGSSYLFFSHLDKDVYILLKIKEKEDIDLIPEKKVEKITVPEETLVSLPVVKEAIENLQEKEIETEEKISVEEEKGVEQTLQLEKSPIAEERDIFYLTEENKVVKVPVKDEESFYRKGLQAFKQGKWNSALESFFEYLEECKECEKREEVWFNIADSYINLNEFEKAIHYLDQVLGSASQEYSKKAMVRKGEILYKKQQFEEAEKILEQASIYNETSPDILIMQGDIHFRLKHYEKAIKVYLKIISLGKGDDEIVFRIALIFDTPGKLRDLEKAYTYYRMVLEKFPHSEHYSYAEERIKFFEKNFFDYK